MHFQLVFAMFAILDHVSALLLIPGSTKVNSSTSWSEMETTSSEMLETAAKSDTQTSERLGLSKVLGELKKLIKPVKSVKVNPYARSAKVVPWAESMLTESTITLKKAWLKNIPSTMKKNLMKAKSLTDVFKLLKGEKEFFDKQDLPLFVKISEKTFDQRGGHDRYGVDVLLTQIGAETLAKMNAHGLSSKDALVVEACKQIVNGLYRKWFDKGLDLHEIKQKIIGSVDWNAYRQFYGSLFETSRFVKLKASHPAE
ncbi:hypothetical protein CCR75_008348 [Bremia lactucae]|uniref:RxLR effector protein n=1 Tax=Bremia lactucae TaxID=4779 RepID=A0A976FMU8_BRELC|nr:hypothetical protein CCR75_008348 [Bremia lactucae]